jgi:hypothetical protein
LVANRDHMRGLFNHDGFLRSDASVEPPELPFSLSSGVA